MRFARMAVAGNDPNREQEGSQWNRSGRFHPSSIPLSAKTLDMVQHGHGCDDPLTQSDITAAGRARQRYRRVSWGALSNFASSAAGMLLMVLTVHWALPYLGAERFGIWATFASFVAMLSFMDLGVGNALVNRVALVSATGEAANLRSVISGGVGWLVLLGCTIILLLTIASALVPWHLVFQLPNPAAGDEAREAAIAFSVVFGLHLVSSGLLKILAGQQRSHEAHVVTTTSTLLACGSTAWATQNQIGIAGLLIAGFGVQTVAGLFVAPVLWRRGQLHLSAVAAGMRAERSVLLTTGSLFLALQIASMIGWGSDSVLLASLSGTAEVAVFAIAQRLFQFVSRPAALINAPLWAAYADAHAHGDRAFLKMTLKRSLLFSFGMGACLASALLLCGHWLIAHWTDGTIKISTTLLVLMAMWTVLEICGSALSIYLNGTGIVREQVLVAAAFCAMALPLKIFGAIEAGAVGLMLATISSYLLMVIVPYATIFRARVLAPCEASSTSKTECVTP